MNSEFPHFRLSEEHDEIRAAVRAVAENKIAPWAAEVDADMRYPQEAHDALVAADFFAPPAGRGEGPGEPGPVVAAGRGERADRVRH